MSAKTKDTSDIKIGRVITLRDVLDIIKVDFVLDCYIKGVKHINYVNKKEIDFRIKTGVYSTGILDKTVSNIDSSVADLGGSVVVVTIR